MKILILDVYPIVPYRVTKDMNGGYGTSNNFGNGLIPRILRSYLAKSADWPPLFAMYAASELRKSGHEVSYQRHFDNDNYDFVVIPSSIVAHETEIEAVKQINQKGIPCAVIGPLATELPEPYLTAGAFVVHGEPEIFFHDFKISSQDLREFSGVVRSDKNIELEELAYPAWDLVINTHAPKMSFIGKGVTLPIIATRGCPYSCFFYCTYPLQQGRKVRQRKPESIVNEMIYWNKNYSVRNFSFRDPVFSINRKHTIELCDHIIKSGIKFNFGIETHLNNLDDELSRKLRDAGLNLVYVGIESVDPEVIKDSHRFTIEQDQQINRIRFLESLGIKVKAMFIFGFPSDTRETIKANILFAQRLLTHFAQFSVFTPYPGTPAFSDFKNKILVAKYENFTQWQLVYKHKVLTPDDISQFLNEAYTKYYLSPRLWLKWFSTLVLKS